MGVVCEQYLRLLPACGMPKTDVDMLHCLGMTMGLYLSFVESGVCTDCVMSLRRICARFVLHDCSLDGDSENMVLIVSDAPSRQIATLDPAIHQRLSETCRQLSHK
jgi:hypothetical protein